MKRKSKLGAAAMLAIMAGSGAAQTRIHLQSQGRSVDFSQATTTRPNRTGTVLPATCQTGETFYKLDDEAGKNLYGCTSTNAWTRLGNPANLEAGVGVAILGGTTVAVDDAVIPYYSTGSGAPSHACRMGQEFYTDSASGQLYYCKGTSVWQALGGSSSVTADAPITLSGGAVGCPTCVVSTGSYTDPAWVTALNADKITSGTLPASRLPATAARTDTANTFSAGLKQVFQPSASSAGIRIASSALPSAAAAGDLAVDTADNKLKWYDGSAWQAVGGGGGGGSFDYDPATTIFQVEEFLSGSATSERIGAWGWIASSCTSCLIPNNSGAYGAFRLATGSTAGTTATIYSLGATQSTLLPSGMFDLRMRVKPGHVDADTSTRFGLNCSMSNTPSGGQPTDGIYAEILAGETAVNGVARSGAAETRTALGTATAGSWHTVRIRRIDGSTIGFALNGGAEQTVTASIPSSGCNIFLNTNNGAAAASKTLEADYVWLKLTGIVR